MRIERNLPAFCLLALLVACAGRAPMHGSLSAPAADAAVAADMFAALDTFASDLLTDALGSSSLPTVSSLPAQPSTTCAVAPGAWQAVYDTGPFLAVQHAGAAVLDVAESIVAPVVARYQARRDAAVAALRTVGFDAPVPQATLYLWIPLPEGASSAAFQTAAMEEEGVIVLGGHSFGASAGGFFRIALTAPEARLEEAAVRLGKVLARS